MFLNTSIYKHIVVFVQTHPQAYPNPGQYPGPRTASKAGREPGSALHSRG